MSELATSDNPDDVNNKRKRITRACDACHKSGTKCEVEGDGLVCRRCESSNLVCTFDRPARKRGPRGALSSESIAPPDSPSQARVVRTSNGHPLRLVPPSPLDNSPWSYIPIAPDADLKGLLDVYYRVVYPIFPFFHWPTFTSNLDSARHHRSQSFCSVVMAVCSLAAARMRDQATPSAVDNSLANVSAEDWYKACLRNVPARLSASTDFDYMRTYALLAILSVQNADLPAFQVHLGSYLTLSAVHSFHQETRWPSDLTDFERDERRHLFWSIYTLDIYAAVVFGGVIRHREALSAVSYPSEALTTYPDGSLPALPDMTGVQVSWLRGWNFTTDLYRILEHIVDKSQRMSTQFTSLFPETYSPDALLAQIQLMYSALPAIFKESKAMTGDPFRDRYSFQAANIIVTMQTLKMALLTYEAPIDRKCQVAGELIDGVCRIPTAYLLAISAPLLHHLAGIGNLLGSMVHSNQLSQYSSLQVRNVLSALSNLLAGLESTLTFTAGTSDRLRVHIDRIDGHIAAASAEQENRQIFHSIIPKDAYSMQTAGASFTPAVQLGNSAYGMSNDLRLVPPATAQSVSAAVSYPQFASSDLFSDWPFQLGLETGSAFDFLTIQPNDSTLL